jgi:hypothetical protein
MLALPYMLKVIVGKKTSCTLRHSSLTKKKDRSAIAACSSNQQEMTVSTSARITNMGMKRTVLRRTPK